MDAIDSVFDPLREFSKDSYRLVKRCHKPDRKEFTKVALSSSLLTTSSSAPLDSVDATSLKTDSREDWTTWFLF
ncbi:hypothetical protein ACET3Z_014303 [Daucus carota]